MTNYETNYDEPIPEKDLCELSMVETKEEIEERLMKVIRKLYMKLECNRLEIENLKRNSNLKSNSNSACWRCGTYPDE